MVHVPAKFRENTSMRFLVTVRKLNVTDRQTDGRTDGQTDGRTDGGRCNISRPGPSEPREIIKCSLGIWRAGSGITDKIILYIRTHTCQRTELSVHIPVSTQTCQHTDLSALVVIYMYTREPLAVDSVCVLASVLASGTLDSGTVVR